MMECDFPIINEKSETIAEIFASVKTIAIVGLSPDESKDSNKVARYLQSQGYKIVPIYPKEDQILGEKVFRSIEDVPFEINMVDMFRKAEIADSLVEQSIKRGDVKVVWLQKGIVNNAALKKAQKAGLKCVQNKCTMIEHGAHR